MRKILLCGVAAVAVGVAWTGPVRAEQPVHNWTGFYAGANVGYGWGNIKATYVRDPYTDDVDLNGIVGGFHAGYNHQMDSVVFGVEGDVNFTDWRDSETIPDPADRKAEVNLLASVRARLGYAFDRGLVFATGGIAFADGDYSAIYNSTKFRTSLNDVGAVVGGGFEWAVLDNVSVRAEGLYYMFGDKKDISDTTITTSFNGDRASFDDAFTLRVGATFHFNGI
jgi:outer membrane immunogenic protein